MYRAGRRPGAVLFVSVDGGMEVPVAFAARGPHGR
eukprot:gene13949-50324_t